MPSHHAQLHDRSFVFFAAAGVEEEIRLTNTPTHTRKEQEYE